MMDWNVVLWKSFFATRLRMTTQVGYKAQINTKLVNDPMNSWSSFMAQHVDQIWTLRNTSHGVPFKHVRERERERENHLHINVGRGQPVASTKDGTWPERCCQYRKTPTLCVEH